MPSALRPEMTAPSDAVVAALGDVLQALAVTDFRLPDVLRVLVERPVQLSRADAGDVGLSEGPGFRLVAYAGIGPEGARLAREAIFKAGRGSVMGRAIADGRTVHVADVLADPEYTLHDLQKIEGYRTVLGVPLMREGRCLGVMGIQCNRVAPFSEYEIRLVSLFADQAAVAIQVATHTVLDGPGVTRQEDRGAECCSPGSS